MRKNNTQPPASLMEGQFLTDGGLETTLIFHKGVDLPHFAAFELMNQPSGRKLLEEYYTPYLEIANQYNLNFILESPTWRANKDWGYKLGYQADELHQINMNSIEFLKSLKPKVAKHLKVLVSGCIGPRGDGYRVDQQMTIESAKTYHSLQIKSFAEAKADLVSGITITYVEEGIGIALAAEAVGLPVVLSFTVETNGCLPGGLPIEKAIQLTDETTNTYPLHYMINCAHPHHFMDQLKTLGPLKARIKAIRANASTKSHEELDQSTELDTGDIDLLSEGYAQLREILPDLRIIGGCCGTDHQHMAAVCQKLFTNPPVPK